MGYTVGITGGIGSGKTAVTDRLAALGIDIVDADQSSRNVVQPGRPALRAIDEHFRGKGHQVLLPDGSMDRALVRKLVFEDERERHWLEALLHPLIGDDIQQRLERVRSSYAILVSPLLIEAGQNRFVQRVCVVDVPEAVQVARTMARDDNDEAQVRAIIGAQLSRQDRLAHADDVIENDGDLQALDRRVRELHALWSDLAARNAQAPAPAAGAGSHAGDAEPGDA